MTLILDAGALIALERGDHVMRRLGQRAYAERSGWSTHGGVVGQVWRDGRRQVGLGRYLRGGRIVPLDAGLGRDAGLLLAHSATSDVIDAALVCLARDGDRIITSDPSDIAHLLAFAGVDAEVVAV